MLSFNNNNNYYDNIRQAVRQCLQTHHHCNLYLPSALSEVLCSCVHSFSSQILMEHLFCVSSRYLGYISGQTKIPALVELSYKLERTNNIYDIIYNTEWWWMIWSQLNRCTGLENDRIGGSISAILDKMLKQTSLRRWLLSRGQNKRNNQTM